MSTGGNYLENEPTVSTIACFEPYIRDDCYHKDLGQWLQLTSVQTDRLLQFEDYTLSVFNNHPPTPTWHAVHSEITHYHYGIHLFSGTVEVTDSPNIHYIHNKSLCNSASHKTLCWAATRLSTSENHRNSLDVLSYDWWVQHLPATYVIGEQVLRQCYRFGVIAPH